MSKHSVKYDVLQIMLMMGECLFRSLNVICDNFTKLQKLLVLLVSDCYRNDCYRTLSLMLEADLVLKILFKLFDYKKKINYFGIIFFLFYFSKILKLLKIILNFYTTFDIPKFLFPFH